MLDNPDLDKIAEAADAALVHPEVFWAKLGYSPEALLQFAAVGALAFQAKMELDFEVPPAMLLASMQLGAALALKSEVVIGDLALLSDEEDD